MRGNWILFENLPLYLFIYFKFWPCPTACGSLGPQAGSEFTFLALEAGVLTTELPEKSGCWLFKFWPGEAIKKVLVASLAFLDFPQQQSINSYPLGQWCLHDPSHGSLFSPFHLFRGCCEASQALLRHSLPSLWVRSHTRILCTRIFHQLPLLRG